MKKFKIYSLILFALLMGANALSQCACYLSFNYVNDCCAELIIETNGMCSANINELSLNSAALGNNSANMVSFTPSPGSPAMTHSLVSSTILNIQTSNLPTTAFVPISIGTICFSDVNGLGGFATPEIELKDNGNVVCSNFVEFGANCPSPVSPTDFKKIYGTADDEFPNQIITTADAIWIAGRKEVNSQFHGSLSKFDLAGTLVCETYFDSASEYLDLVEDPNSGNIMVVGRTLPYETAGAPQNNFSLALVFNTSCNLIWKRIYNQSGQESFNKIVIQSNPLIATHPVYILGEKRPLTPIAGKKVTTLFNMSETLGFNWSTDYEDSSTSDFEADKGLMAMSNGNLLVMGSGTSFSQGLFFEADGSFVGFPTGGGIAYQTGNFLEFYDAIEHNNGGDILIVGKETQTGFSTILSFDPSNSWSFEASTLVIDSEGFKKISRDSNGDYYTTARSAINNNENIVHKWQYDEPSASFNHLWDKFLFDGAQDFLNPCIDVTNAHNKIFFADARLNHPSGPGNHDLLLTQTDLDYSCYCVENAVSNFTLYGAGIFQNTIPLTTNFNFTEPGFNPHSIVLPSSGICEPFCADTCEVDLSCDIDCFTADFTATPNFGSAPYFYEWDEDCDGLFEASGNSNMHQVIHPPMPSSQTHLICVRVTDANGVTCEEMKTYSVADTIPPLLSCPVNQTLCADPGLCTATFQIPQIAADNCDPNPVITCTLTGATIGDETTTNFNYGVTNITCTATDASGNSVSCSFTIWVIDCEDPEITCPQNIHATADVCDGGINVVLPPPTATDNCPNVSYFCSHQSGDFFPCGTTTVSCTAVDQDGNTDTCTYDVIVDCDCAEVGAASLACDPIDPNLYHFTVTMNGLSGSINPWSACNTNVVANMPGITVSNVTTTWFGSAATMTGTIDYTGICPSDILLTATMNCVCSNSALFNCSKDFSIPAICCRSISIDDASICKDAGQNLSVPLIGCADLCDVQQVKWYVANGPCPPASGTWGAPFLTALTCQDLIIDPRPLNGEICVYAEVITSSSTDPCGNLFSSNVATINICEPVQVSVNQSQNHCFDGTPWMPSSLTAVVANGNSNCNYSIQWYENGLLIPGATSNMYQPPALSIPVGSTLCNMQWTYTATVTPEECDPVNASAIIQLDNDDAPLGSLYMDPAETLPLCPGEDLTLKYDEECAGDPAEWEWHTKPDGGIYSHLVNQGTMNPLYNTNRLYVDTWFKIEKTNGSCPTDEIEIFIPVQDQITANIQAFPAPICDPTSVKLVLTFAPSLTVPNNYTIEWYRDGNIITTGTAQVSPISYTYVPGNGDIRGNYYAIISNNSCPGSVKTNVEVIEAPCHLEIAGPCYRCDNEIVQLDAIITNPMQGASCTYQWFDNGAAIPGAIGTSLMVQPSQFGPFRFDCTCVIGGTTCVKSETFDLLQCFCPDSDGDSVCDAEDQCPGEDDSLDADGNGIPDCLLDPTACDPMNFLNAPTGLFVDQSISNGIKTQLLWDHYSDAADGCILRGGAIDALDINANYIQSPGQVLVQGNAINGLPNGFDYSAPLGANSSFQLFNPTTFPAGGTGMMLPGEFYKWQVRCGCVIDPTLPLPDRLALSNVNLTPWSDFNLFTNLSLTPFTNQNEELGAFEEEDMKIYPNPFKEELIVDLSQFTLHGLRVELLDILGKLVLSRDLSNQDEVFIKFNTQNLLPGAYIIKLRTKEKVISKKVIK